jgi:tripartite-type tricarboxylate transporter receptor subunit TctC
MPVFSPHRTIAAACLMAMNAGRSWNAKVKESKAMELRVVVAALGVWACCAGNLQAQSLEEFYSKQTVTIISAFNAGGGNDIYCRLIARYLGRYIPGKPNVVVQNMPGAASIRATNYIWQVAPRDGTVIANIQRTVPLHAALGKDFVFDVRKFTWVGSSSSFSDDAYVLFVRSDADVKTLDDLRKPGGKPLILSGTAPGSTSADVPALLREILGLNFKIIHGYADSPAEIIALERKEVDGRIATLSSVRAAAPGWLKPESNIRPMLQYAREIRLPELAGIPTARELARNDEERQLLEISELSYKFGRPFIAPPEVPRERAKALQDAFLAAHKDPDFLADAEKLQLDISPAGGDEIFTYINRFDGARPELLAKIKKILDMQR